jgi:hypothetical protein
MVGTPNGPLAPHFSRCQASTRTLSSWPVGLRRANGQLSGRQADVLRHIARRWGIETPVRDAFVDWAPRIIRTPAPPPRVRSPRPGEITQRLGRHEVVLRTGEVVTLLELLETGLQARGAGRRSPVRVLRDAAASALAEREDGMDDDSEEDDDAPL